MQLSTAVLSTLLLLPWASSFAQTTPTTRRDDTDQATQDLLKDIDAGAAHVRESNPKPEDPGRTGRGPERAGNSLLDHVRAEYLPTLQVVWPALLVAVALAIAGGITGTFMVLRRESLLALSVPQVVMLGAAVGLRLGWPTLPPAMVTVAVALILMAWCRRRDAENLVLPALYIAGVCLSMLVIANAGAHLMEVQNLFTGIDVAVGERQAVVIGSILLSTGVVCALFWRRWLLLAQAPAVAELARLHPVRWNALFLCLLATVLVLATHAVGTVMVIALLFLPAASVLPWTRRIPNAIRASAIIAVLAVAIGFVLSVEMGWPLSHSVGGAGFALFLLSHSVVQLVR